MTTEQIEQLAFELVRHFQACQQLLKLLEAENRKLQEESQLDHQQSTFHRKNILAELSGSLDKIRAHRVEWTRLDSRLKAGHPGIGELLRQTQDVLMKVMLLDRENEQLLLRKGMLPARQIPQLAQTKPHYVAGLYQRHAPG